MSEVFFFFNDTATTEIYTLSLHDALPICEEPPDRLLLPEHTPDRDPEVDELVTLALRLQSARPLQADPDFARQDRKSTRLNSSHQIISYAVFCLKKKKYKSR